MDVGSDHQSPLNVCCRFFRLRVAESITSTTTLRPTSSHISAMASLMGLSFAMNPAVVSR
jgi:hypothetical protein